jgi:hypothetical protein
MGYTAIAQAKAIEKLVVTGSRELEANLQAWLGLSRFARLEKLVA